MGAEALTKKNWGDEARFNGGVRRIWDLGFLNLGLGVFEFGTWGCEVKEREAESNPEREWEQRP